MPTYTRVLILYPVGFIAAVSAAGLVVAIALVGGGNSSSPPRFIFFAATWMAIFAGFFAFVPWLVAAIVAASLGLRSAAYWLAIGCGIGAAGYFLGDLPGWPSGGYALAVHLLAGLVAGLVFWLIAVRAAGVRYVPLGEPRLE